MFYPLNIANTNTKCFWNMVPIVGFQVISVPKQITRYIRFLSNEIDLGECLIWIGKAPSGDRSVVANTSGLFNIGTCFCSYFYIRSICLVVLRRLLALWLLECLSRPSMVWGGLVGSVPFGCAYQIQSKSTKGSSLVEHRNRRARESGLGLATIAAGLLLSKNTQTVVFSMAWAANSHVCLADCELLNV